MSELSSAIAAAREALRNSHATANERPHWLALEAAMSDLLAALDAAQPVAWQVTRLGFPYRYVVRADVADEICCDLRKDNPADSIEARPLYLAPQAPPAAVPAEEGKYAELLYAVESKWPGESRHETALRYIREREAGTVSTAAQSATLAAANKENNNG